MLCTCPRAKPSAFLPFLSNLARAHLFSLFCLPLFPCACMYVLMLAVLSFLGCVRVQLFASPSSLCVCVPVLRFLLYLLICVPMFLPAWVLLFSSVFLFNFVCMWMGCCSPFCLHRASSGLCR